MYTYDKKGKKEQWFELKKTESKVRIGENRTELEYSEQLVHKPSLFMLLSILISSSSNLNFLDKKDPLDQLTTIQSEIGVR